MSKYGDTIRAPADVTERIKGLFDAFNAAANDTEIVVHICMIDADVGIAIDCANSTSVLRLDEAKAVIKAMEAAMHIMEGVEAGTTSQLEREGIPNLLLGLRYAVERAEQEGEAVIQEFVKTHVN